MTGWDPVTGAATIAHQLHVAGVAAGELAEGTGAPLLPDAAEWSGPAADAFRDRADELRLALRRAQAGAELACSTGRTALAQAAP